MPRGETFHNPYRWVPVPPGQPNRSAPRYRHRQDGHTGRFTCRLTVLTPLLIGDGGRASGVSGDIRFVRTPLPERRPYIPATSLKGMLRSVAELVTGSAVPTDKQQVDRDHRASRAAAGDGTHRQLDTAARIFGCISGERSANGNAQLATGNVQFSDAALDQPAPGDDGDADRWPAFTVEVGQPKPAHRSFYPGDHLRKLYHHVPGATELRPCPPGIDQNRTVRPAPPGTSFRFTVGFQNLDERDLAVLTYVLFLLDEVTITLSKEALGTEQPQTITGPLRHKLGACKPQGGGSVAIAPLHLTLQPAAADRYRRGQRTSADLSGDALQQWIAPRTQQVHTGMAADTRTALEVMLIYADNDPRAADMHYPGYGWFKASNPPNSQTPLKPTC